MWRGVDPLNLTDTIGVFAAAAAVAVRAGHQESAGVSAQYLRQFRQAEGVVGALAVTIDEPPDNEVAAAVVRAAGLGAIIRGRQRGFSPRAAARNGLVKASGASSSLVLAGSRDVINEAVRSDRQARGWQRITGAEPCSFCAEIAARGVLFKGEAGEVFQRHDHDACFPEPAFEGTEMPPRNREFRELWERATEGRSGTDALNAFRRAREGRPLEGDPITS